MHVKKEFHSDDISMTLQAIPGRNIEDFKADVKTHSDGEPFRINLRLYENRIPIRVTLRYRGRDRVKIYEPSNDEIYDNIVLGHHGEPSAPVLIRIKHTWGMQY